MYQPAEELLLINLLMRRDSGSSRSGPCEHQIYEDWKITCLGNTVYMEPVKSMATHECRRWVVLDHGISKIDMCV